MTTQASTTHLPEKVIRIPASQPVSVGPFLPVIDHPLFQKLRGRKQLGVNNLVFPGAEHTRFEHAIGVLGLTQRVCQIQRLSERDVLDLCMYALVHDVGHGPFSHQIEPVVQGTHHDQCLRVLERMAGEVHACGVEPDTIRRMFTGEDTRRNWVSDRNLVTDKLDYLQRDALHIGFTGVPDIEQLLLYTVMVDGTLAIEEKFMEEIKRLQKFYSYLHQHGYLNKTALSVQRVFQRAVEEELSEGRTSPEALWEMTDAELMRWLHGGRSRIAARLIEHVETRTLYRSTIVIKPTGYAFVERTACKPVRVAEWSRPKLRAFSDVVSDPAAMRRLEDRVAEQAGLAPGELLFAAMPYFDKLLPRDVRIYRKDGQHFQLFERDRYHHNSLQGDYLSTFAIRLIAVPERRNAVIRCAQSILALLEEAIADSMPQPKQTFRPRRGELFQ